LIDAEAGDSTGYDAAIRILGWEDTELKVEELSSNNRRIDASIVHLLMEAARVTDEKTDASPHDLLINEVVKLSEARHFKKAQGKLKGFLKANPKSYKGWLWYSRITDNITFIEKSLNNAKLIAPNDPEVVEEIKKVELAKGMLADGQITHCPFCWAPVNLNVLECSYCQAHLFVHEELFTSTKAANRQVLQQAVDRFTRVITGGTNPAVHYYLGIAHLNLGQWEKGLDHLNFSVETFPDEESYADQLYMLMNLLTSNKAIFDQEAVVEKKGPDLAPATDEGTDKKKILVVESSPTIRKVISITLSKRGYEVIEAGNGLEALNCLDKTKPDMILMDVVLPKIDGYKILSIIQDSTELKDTPVIILTSKEGIVSRVKQKFTGSTAYLPKPFDLSKLLETTEKNLH
jgi:twitching motility two-component system response regulator PilG